MNSHRNEKRKRQKKRQDSLCFWYKKRIDPQVVRGEGSGGVGRGGAGLQPGRPI
ncbi:hypothetical protein LguiA_027819 [Lonicera macranthoides]